MMNIIDSNDGAINRTNNMPKNLTVESPLSARLPTGNCFGLGGYDYNNRKRRRMDIAHEDGLSKAKIDYNLALEQAMVRINCLDLEKDKEQAMATVLGEEPITCIDSQTDNQSSRTSAVLRKSTLTRLNIEHASVENRFGGLPENPEFLQQKFQELEMVIQASTANPEFAAYRQALDKNASYVKHPLFRICFLRAEHYNARKAAARLLRHLTEKLELFGPDKLTRDIVLDDLGRDARTCLEIGTLQILPVRDNAGRRVVFYAEVLRAPANERGVLAARKAWFYFWTSVVEDDNDVGRIKGVVVVNWRVHNPVVQTRKSAEAIIRTFYLNSPCRISATHLCHGPKSNFNIVSVYNYWRLWDPSFRSMREVRLLHRVHYGEVVECMYTLCQEYGIPANCFPLIRGASARQPTMLEVVKSKNKHTLFFEDQHNLVTDWLARRKTIDERKKQIQHLLDSLVDSNGPVEDTLLQSITSADGSINNSCLGFLLSKNASMNSQIASLTPSSPLDEPLRLSLISLNTSKGRHSLFSDSSLIERDSMMSNSLIRQSLFSNASSAGRDSMMSNSILRGSIGKISDSGSLMGSDSNMSLENFEQEDRTSIQGAMVVIDPSVLSLNNETEEKVSNRLSSTSMQNAIIDGVMKDLDKRNSIESFEIILDNVENVQEGEAINISSNESQIEGEPILGTSTSGIIRDCDTRPEDVKLGRGKPLQRHPGNIWFRNLVANYFDVYDALKRAQKTELSERIVDQVRMEGRRLLKPKDGDWVEVDEKEAREKVAFTFRTERKNRANMNKAMGQ